MQKTLAYFYKGFFIVMLITSKYSALKYLFFSCQNRKKNYGKEAISLTMVNKCEQVQNFAVLKELK
jgi:hypothetical protein